MHSITLWKLAQSPNYMTNVDKLYPYSELPYLGQYKLVKLPTTVNQLIDFVDYWGEGKISSQHGVSGFSNCYNVNHPYQLVSNGPDRGKKIPNRIPVPSYTDCDTRSYIKDNSVILVTVMGAPINQSCDADIARILHKSFGQVVVYGFDINSQDIANLTAELAKKSIYHCPGYQLPSHLQGLTLFDSHLAFLNVTTAKSELSKLIINGAYDDAVTLSKNLISDSDGSLSNVVQGLITADSTTNTKLMAYAYKLWNNGAKDIVRNHFPDQFKLIFGQENVTICNKGYLQALKLSAAVDSSNRRSVWGDNDDMKSKRVCWQLIPVWLNNSVTFKLYNVDCDMYLELDVNADSDGDRNTWGSKNSAEESLKYYLEPIIKDGEIQFYIVNSQYRQGLKLAINADSEGDRRLYGHNGDIYNGEGRFRWAIAAWSSI
ncbi:microvitellogenin-like [Anticarsia gemmatalis]|uniref:microvitellogenin-like n=1 Tax=Anticarsia gemmatalis TaxID=129554 RepID=UPI003F778281